MEQKKYATISIRMEAGELERLKAIALAESRFTSSQARYWLRQCIRDYESRTGPEYAAAPCGLRAGGKQD